MNNRFKPVSRLTIVFILAVVISGGILTYFSINGISKLKEITEKRVIEEQRELATRFVASIQNKLEAVTIGFKNEIRQSGSMKDSLIKTATKHDFVILPFILRNNGSFIYPNFRDILENISKPTHSNRFKSAFRNGQDAEFVKKNLQIAKKRYLSCLNYSTRSNDSVKALNALGRISVKLNEYEDAIGHYKSVVLKYFEIVSEDGFPYAYFAVPQLLKITNPYNKEEIFQIIKIFLEKTETGLIPLNFNTEELLTLVNNWLQENSFNNIEKLAHIDELKKSIDQQLQFINENKVDLSEVLKKRGFNNKLESVNNFKVINSSTENYERLILINTNYKNPSGFLVDGEKLLDIILKSELQSEFEFDYNIEFPIKFDSNTTMDDLIYSSQLNPYFPSKKIQIKLNDENLLKELINRKSWTYGIATVLLLLALFLGVVLIIRDIAREKNLARLQSDFISNVTHELKTPLTSIYLFTELLLLKRVKKESDKDEYLSIILRESERLKRMMNNILDFSKSEIGKQEYRFVRSNLASIINAAIHEMDYWFENDKFDVIIELDENIDAKVDAEKIKQVMGNLLSNAFKYSTDKKKIVIRLYKKKKEIHIEVEDHGIGISEEKIPRLFEKFYRVDQKEGISGTGLGLTVVRDIIEAHGGKISVSSIIGKGSIFSITLNHNLAKE